MSVNVVQREEVSSLEAIYGDDFVRDGENDIKIKISIKKFEVILNIMLLATYPTESPPQYELSTPWMCRGDKQKLTAELDRLYLDNIGEPVIFRWVEKIRETLWSLKLPKTQRRCKGNPAYSSSAGTIVKCPEIIHGDVIVDRKSSFQAHVAQVHSVEEVNAVLLRLKEAKKVANATHNVFAWRYESGEIKKKGIVQECSDDGEAQAGGRLMHLLERMQMRNAIVVVSRWRGPVQLGADRFRHYNNAAKQVLLQAGITTK